MFTKYWATDDDDEDDTDTDISKYRNPSPPPGYVEEKVTIRMINSDEASNRSQLFFDSNLTTIPSNETKSHSVERKVCRDKLSHHKKRKRRASKSTCKKCVTHEHCEHSSEAKIDQVKRDCLKSPLLSPREGVKEFVERMKSARESVERKLSRKYFKYSVERKKSPRESVERKMSPRESVERKKSPRDSVERKLSRKYVKDSVERKKSPSESVPLSIKGEPFEHYTVPSMENVQAGNFIKNPVSYGEPFGYYTLPNVENFQAGHFITNAASNGEPFMYYAVPNVDNFQAENFIQNADSRIKARKRIQNPCNLIVVPVVEHIRSRPLSALKIIETIPVSDNALKRDSLSLPHTERYTRKLHTSFMNQNPEIPTSSVKIESKASPEEPVVSKLRDVDHSQMSSSGDWRPITASPSSSKPVVLKYQSKVTKSDKSDKQLSKGLSSKDLRLKLSKELNKKEQPSASIELNRKVKTEIVPSTIIDIYDNIDFPCVGLDYVYEIQRSSPLHDVVYHCDLCHAKCGQRTILLHLKNFKHYLRCLKKYRPLIYQNFKTEKKRKIAKPVEDCIRDLEKDIGRGNMKIRPKYKESSLSMSDISSDESGSFSPGLKDVSKSLNRYFESDKSSRSGHKSNKKSAKDANRGTRRERPDRSMGDFYCQVCDSHMSTMQIWESHIVGKRHRRNLNKGPGEKPSKVKTAVQSDLSPFLTKSLDDVTDAVVGLDFISEIRKSAKDVNESEALVRYACYLCSGSHTRLTVIDHILSTRHRMNYLKEVRPKEYDLAMELDFSKDAFDDFLTNKAFEMQTRFGRGSIEVRAEIQD